MKNLTPRRVVSPVTYFLSGLFLLLCLLLPVRAQDLTISTNIGSPSGGSDSYDSGTSTYAITGLGQGVEFSGFGGNDKMHFLSKQVTGDVEIKVHVVSFGNSGEGNVGLAIRAGTGTGDDMGTALFIPYHTYNSGPIMLDWCRGPWLDGNPYYDPQGKGSSTHPSLAPPFWLKLVRVGNNYGGYWSKDGNDWYLLSNTSGGAFFPAGTYNVGILVSSGSDTVSSTAVIDNVTVGTPAPKYKTSWVGSTSAGVAAGFPSNQVYSMWVKPDGTCYTESSWDEGGQPGKVIKDGKVLHGFYSSNGGGGEGCVTGNATHLFYYDNHGPNVYRSDFATNSPTALTFTGTALGEVRGLAASASTIFVSDYAHGLVRAVNASTLAEITTGNFPISLPRCGPIAYDGANFWIVQAATSDAAPFSWYVVGTDPTSILCFQPDGTPLPLKTITWTSPDKCIPTALAYQDLTPVGTTGANDILWVCDNSPHQYIRKYNNLNAATPPTPSGTPLGVDGGLWPAGVGTPGLIKDTATGAGTDKRFYGPTGVGTDSQGNVYVACNGASYYVSDIRKFNSGGTLQWRINGLVFVQAGDFDPKAGDNGANIYLPEKHLTMNYSNLTAGSEWTYKSFTRDLTKNNREARNYGNPTGVSVCGVKLARLGSPADLFMYTSGQGVVGTMCLYYYKGEIAVPYGTYVQGLSGINHLWIDANNNQTVDTGEETTAPSTFLAGEIQSFDVDALGDVWLAYRGTPGGIRRLVNQGAGPMGGVAGQPQIPKYNLTTAGTGYVDYKTPPPLTAVSNVSFDSTTDTLYAIGQTSGGTWKLVRYNNWKAGADNQLNAVAAWAVDLPAEPDFSILFPLPAKDQYMGMDLAVDKLFVAELYGPAHVYDAALGNLEFTLNPGAEVSAKMGWVDMSMGINAYKRTTGEYLILQDQTGFNACDFLYRWTPAADTAASAAPTALTAAAGGRKIVLNWNGPTGMITSYKLYRGTSSGSETLYQSGILSPTFTDLNVTPGTIYYYKVTAVNAVGESAQSSEASAAAASGAAEYVKTDMTTQGAWRGVYGSEGYEISDLTNNYPTYLTGSGSVTYSTYPDPSWPPPVNIRTATWANPVTDDPLNPTTHANFLRALQKPSPATDRIAAFRANGTAYPFSWNLNPSDTSTWHQVAVYVLDWGSTGAGLYVQVVDAATDTVLDTRKIGNSTNGKYVVWNVSGNVKVKVLQDPYTIETVASGIFFDPLTVPTPGVGWWKFEETTGTTAADSSGTGHNGTTSGCTWNASGKVNRCLNVPGGSAYVSIPTGLITGKNPVSLSAWFKTSSVAGAVIAGYANAGSSPTAYVPVLYVGTDGKLRGTYYTGVTSALASTATVNNGAWHHAALVGSGATQALYLDGALVDYRAGAISTTAMNYNYIGKIKTTGWPSMTGSGDNFNGQLDEVRLDNRALTPGQIYTLANP